MSLVRVHQKGMVTIVDKDKDTVHELPLEGTRGSIVSIACWCEGGGHSFDMILKFHKGSTFIGYSQVPDDVDYRHTELWRD